MTAKTAIKRLNAATLALREAFETHGNVWNENGKTLVDFQNAEHVAEMSGRVQYLETMRDEFKNYDFAITKAAPHIAEIASTRVPCDLFYGDNSEEDVRAVEDFSLTMCAFIACFDKSNEEIAIEISAFIAEKDEDFDFTGGHTIAGAWDKGTNPDEIELTEVENVLDLALEGWADDESWNLQSVREPALMYLHALRRYPAIMEILAAEWLEIIRAQWTSEET